MTACTASQLQPLLSAKSNPFTIQEFHHVGFSHPHPDDTIAGLRFYSVSLRRFSKQQYDACWPLISAVHTKLGGLLLQKNGTIDVQNYECRLRRSRKSGEALTPKDGVKKRYGTTVLLVECTDQNNAYRKSAYRRQLNGSATTNICIHLIELEKHYQSNWLR